MSGSASMYATERRGGHLGAAQISGCLVEGGAELDPSQAPDSSRSAAIGSLTFEYRVTWRSIENEQARQSLVDAGYYWFRGGPTHPSTSRLRHHLKIQARNADEATARIRQVIESAGGNASDLTVGRPDPDRVRRMQRAAAEAERNLAA